MGRTSSLNTCDNRIQPPIGSGSSGRRWSVGENPTLDTGQPVPWAILDPLQTFAAGIDGSSPSPPFQTLLGATAGGSIGRISAVRTADCSFRSSARQLPLTR